MYIYSKLLSDVCLELCKSRGCFRVSTLLFVTMNNSHGETSLWVRNSWFCRVGKNSELLYTDSTYCSTKRLVLSFPTPLDFPIKMSFRLNSHFLSLTSAK